MKKIIGLTFLMFFVSSSSYAEGVFVGAEGGIVNHPQYSAKMMDYATSSGSFSWAGSNEKTSVFGYGVRIGQWVNNSFGWELGYDNLGTSSGYMVTNGPTGNGTWNFSVVAVHAVVLGGIKMNSGTLFGKAGIFKATTTLDGTYVIGGGPYSQSASSSGLMLGTGWIFSFTKHLLGRAQIELYNGVKYTSLINFSNTNSELVYKNSFGVDYLF